MLFPYFLKDSDWLCGLSNLALIFGDFHFNDLQLSYRITWLLFFRRQLNWIKLVKLVNALIKLQLLKLLLSCILNLERLMMLSPVISLNKLCVYPFIGTNVNDLTTLNGHVLHRVNVTQTLLYIILQFLLPKNHVVSIDSQCSSMELRYLIVVELRRVVELERRLALISWISRCKHFLLFLVSRRFLITNDVRYESWFLRRIYLGFFFCSKVLLLLYWLY